MGLQEGQVEAHKVQGERFKFTAHPAERTVKFYEYELFLSLYQSSHFHG